MARIAFVVQLPKGKSPSQRFRCEAWEPAMTTAGHTFDYFPFFSAGAAAILYQPGRIFQKAMAVGSGFWNRVKLTLRARKYDFFFVQREASPIGPPLFEWFWTRILGKKLIFDFDDAIWIPAESAANSLATRFKAFWKIGRICSYATTVVGGNDFLCEFAQQYVRQGKVVKLPTVVDTDTRYIPLPASSHTGRVRVGWTGSHSTLPYLNAIVPVLQKLQSELPFEFVVIADKVPYLELTNWYFIPWNATTEIDDLLQIQIGIMPLTPDLWSEGKCGFKLIQYGGVGIPAVASPVGVNSAIIRESQTGFLAGNAAEWEASLRLLITDAPLREKMGAAARKKIVAEYSLAAHVPTFLGLFED